MSGLHFLLLFPIFFCCCCCFGRVTPLKRWAPGGSPCLLGVFCSLWHDAPQIPHSPLAESWVLTRPLVIFECCRCAMLYWRVICQFHYKPHLQLSWFKSDQTVSWHVQRVSWDIGLACWGTWSRRPPPCLQNHRLKKLILLIFSIIFFPCVWAKHLSSGYFSFPSSRESSNVFFLLVLHQLWLYLPSWAWVGPAGSHGLLRRVRLCRIWELSWGLSCCLACNQVGRETRDFAHRKSWGTNEIWIWPQIFS